MARNAARRGWSSLSSGDTCFAVLTLLSLFDTGQWVA